MWRTALVLLLISTACGSAVAPTASLASSSARQTVTPGKGFGVPYPASDSRVTYPSPPEYSGGQPLARGSGMLASDAQGDLVLFGGENFTSVLSDTWTWDGHSWTYIPYTGTASAARSATGAPEARRAGTMFYDPRSRSTILFGGWSASDVMLSDTWSWNGAWTQLHPAMSPSPRSWAAAAFDPSLNEAILQGGWAGNTTFLTDTWAWNGSTWSKLDVPGNPTGSFQAVLGYRAAKHDMQLVPLDGGSVWLFDGTRWAAAPTGGSAPGCRYGGGSADDIDSSIVVFGGNCATNVWDGASWSSVPDSDTQPSRRGDEGGSPMMAYLPGAGAVILYGGHVSGYGYGTDLWIWTKGRWYLQQ